MSMLLFLFYLIDVVATLKIVAVFVSVLFGVISILCFSYSWSCAYLNEQRDKDAEEVKNPLKSTQRTAITVTILSLLACIVLPSKSTMQVIVAGKAAEYSYNFISESPIIQKSKLVIEKKLDDIITDMTDNHEESTKKE